MIIGIGNKRLYRTSYTIILVLFLTGCTVLSKGEQAVPELIDPVSVKVDVLEVRRGTLSVEISGVVVVVPSTTEYQSFEIDGKLDKAFVQPGASVKKGDVLFQLDSGNSNLQLIQQQLMVENMQRVLDTSLEAGLDKGTIDDIKLHQMNLKIEQLRLKQLLERIDKQTIVSSSEGVVTFVDDIRAGDQITAYRSVIGIAQTNKLQLRYVGELAPFLSDIKLGMPVELVYQGSSRKAMLAASPLITSISSDSSPLRAAILEKTLLFDVDVELKDIINIGEPIEFKLELKRKENTLIIPRAALRNYQGRDYVLIVDGDIHREIDVQRGIVTPTEVEIVSGLEVGQQIVVTK